MMLAGRASAQVTKGEASMNLNGSLGVGYQDDSTNFSGSDHSIVGFGEADLFGSYHDPNFLSFQVQPFYNQSRLNSSFQSITASSGVSGSARIFGGSQFPGSISYNDNYNSTGNFTVPGLANFTTRGNSDSLAINWGVNLHNLPTLHFAFTDADSDYSVYGANTLGRSHINTFSVTSTYRIAGFNFTGGYQNSGSKALTPDFLTGEPSEQTNTTVNSYFLGVGHNLPGHGSFTASAARYDISTAFGVDTSFSDKYDTKIDTLNAGASFAPVRHLTLGTNTYYTDNLEGTLYNTLLTAGVIAPQLAAPESSHSLSITGFANYEMPEQHLQFNAFIERQQQTFLGISFADESYNGTADYSNTLLGGTFNGVLGLTYTNIDTNSQTLLGVTSMVNYSHAIQRWNVAGSFGFSQDTQTVLIAYTTSGYTYSGIVGRRIRRRSYWSVNASGARTLLTGLPGTASDTQNYSTSLSLPQITVSGAYSRSTGNALLTPTGLVATPVPVTVLNPGAVVLFNGNTYSAGVSSTPIRGLILSGTFSKALSSTTGNSLASNNNIENGYFLVSYRVRKLNFQAGYSRLLQGFTSAGTPPAIDNSYFVGVTRWFSFF